MTTDVPSDSYGVLEQNSVASSLDEAAEQLGNLGYAILNSGYTARELATIAEQFDRTRERYIATHTASRLLEVNEIHTIRSPLIHGGEVFLRLALNEIVLSLLKMSMVGKFILNQQNGVINPPREGYNQGIWHRDLPYQHFVSTRPLAINALFCVDDFTHENGATFVLPASHKSEALPSASYVRRNAIQVEAAAGDFIVVDCMAFHAGGFNRTNLPRRAVNHVYSIPYFKQQINLPKNMGRGSLSSEARDILGFNYQEPASIDEYLSTRSNKKY